VDDVSGNNNYGTMSGATRTSSGRYGRALNFDGTNDWVTVNDAASLDLTSGMTLEAWVYPTAPMTGWHGVLGKDVDIFYLMASSATDTPAIGGTFTVGGNSNTFAPSPLPLNVWTHLAATFDGAQVKLYVNGVLQGMQPHPHVLVYDTRPLWLGRSGECGGPGEANYDGYLNGRLDDVRIYSRALSADEIAALAAGQ
jgi:hypothetical protein